MKRILILLLALCLCAALFACDKSDVPQGYLDAGTKGVDYRFFYPDTWALSRSDPGMTQVYVESDHANVSVTVYTASPSPESLADYAENYYFKQFESNFNNLQKELNQNGSLKWSALKVDGCDAISVEYSADFAGENFRFQSVFISYNGAIYTVLYTAPRDVFDSHREAVQGMIEQMRFQ